MAMAMISLHMRLAHLLPSDCTDSFAELLHIDRPNYEQAKMQTAKLTTRTMTGARSAGVTGFNATAKRWLHPIPDDARFPPESESQESVNTFSARQHRLSRGKNVRDSTQGPFESNVRGSFSKACTSTNRPRATDAPSTITDVAKVRTERYSRPTAAD